MAEQDMVDVLASDHRHLQRLLSDAQGSGNAEHFRDTVEELVAGLVRHATAEEQYLHPLLRDALDGGDALAAAGHAGDRHIEDVLRALEHTEPQDAAPVLAQLGTALREHVQRQDEQFAALRQHVTHSWLVDLGDEVLGAEQLAPDRPRPVAPQNPTLARITAITQGYVDEVRDAYRHHPDGEAPTAP